jgi:uncharacterized cupredoxin-like copper-binding protein
MNWEDMVMKKWMLALAAVSLMGVLAGCSKGPKTVEIEVKNMAFSAKEIALKTGVPVRLVLNNKDTVTHDLSVDTIPVTITAQTKNPEGHAHEGEKEPDLHLGAKAGEKGWVEFTPTAEGTYTFYCTVDGHKESGMQGTLVVTADGKLPKGK